jgi:hypothetical protein
MYIFLYISSLFHPQQLNNIMIYHICIYVHVHVQSTHTGPHRNVAEDQERVNLVAIVSNVLRFGSQLRDAREIPGQILARLAPVELEAQALAPLKSLWQQASAYNPAGTFYVSVVL